jgi:hypothetical protein
LTLSFFSCFFENLKSFYTFLQILHIFKVPKYSTFNAYDSMALPVSINYNTLRAFLLLANCSMLIRRPFFRERRTQTASDYRKHNIYTVNDKFKNYQLVINLSLSVHRTTSPGSIPNLK